MKRCVSGNRHDYRTENTSGKMKTPKPSTPETHIHHRSKERQSSDKTIHSNQYLLKNSSANKQQNFSSDISRYTPVNDSPVVEVTVKTSSPPKQRSRSTVSDRQPWGQLLNKHTFGENESVFGKCDPLRTLHFLARELQTTMQARLPGETNLQELIKAMHAALKRIPPEVASTVQLQQQTLDLLPKLKSSTSRDSLDDKLDNIKAVQTPKNSQREFGEIQKLIENSTKKLEASCRHLENICGQLRDEKLSLQSLLQNERTNSRLLQIRIEELDNANKQLSLCVTQKDQELAQLKSAMVTLESELQERKFPNTDMQATINEVKKSKVQLEQETLKLEHKLRLCAIEKEKYLAILAVRDRQIYEIRNEMTQLQQSVNEQLVELHNYATASVPEHHMVDSGQQMVDSISAIYGNENVCRDDYSDDDKK